MPTRCSCPPESCRGNVSTGSAATTESGDAPLDPRPGSSGSSTLRRGQHRQQVVGAEDEPCFAIAVRRLPPTAVCTPSITTPRSAVEPPSGWQWSCRPDGPISAKIAGGIRARPRRRSVVPRMWAAARPGLRPENSSRPSTSPMHRRWWTLTRPGLQSSQDFTDRRRLPAFTAAPRIAVPQTRESAAFGSERARQHLTLARPVVGRPRSAGVTRPSHVRQDRGRADRAAGRAPWTLASRSGR
jgi:hypothetical protein